jgi:hypothetical protein
MHTRISKEGFFFNWWNPRTFALGQSTTIIIDNNWQDFSILLFGRRLFLPILAKCKKKQQNNVVKVTLY